MPSFTKDILLIDFETTDIDPAEAEPIQLAAVLLDKVTLEEKDSFRSYITADLSKANPESLNVSGINQEMLTGAPSAAEVIKLFSDKFGFDVLLASWVEFLDRRMLYKMAASAKIAHQYDYHYLDLWPIAYTYLIRNGYTGSIKSSDMFTALGAPKRDDHDALEDCRIEAEILRKII